MGFVRCLYQFVQLLSYVRFRGGIEERCTCREKGVDSREVSDTYLGEFSPALDVQHLSVDDDPVWFLTYCIGGEAGGLSGLAYEGSIEEPKPLERIGSDCVEEGEPHCDLGLDTRQEVVHELERCGGDRLILEKGLEDDVAVTRLQ